MERNTNESGIICKKYTLTNKKIIINQITDTLFDAISDTGILLPMSYNNSGHKIIICMSSHHFIINDMLLKSSGLVARTNDPSSIYDVKNILDEIPDSIILLSLIAKKYYDKETSLQQYKSKIFSLKKGTDCITNKHIDKYNPCPRYKKI